MAAVDAHSSRAAVRSSGAQPNPSGAVRIVVTPCSAGPIASSASDRIAVSTWTWGSMKPGLARARSVDDQPAPDGDVETARLHSA
jgi:hypothetical protein